MSMPDPSPLTVRECRGLEGLHSLRDDWLRLSTIAGHYFHEFGWFVEFARYACRDVDELRLLVVCNSGGVPVAIVPVEHRTEAIRRIPFGIWTVLGAMPDDISMMASGSDILCESHALALPVLQAITRHLARARPRNSLLFIGRMTSEAIVYEACRAFSRASHYERGATDWISTRRSFADLHASLSRKFRATLRNMANRASASGHIEYHMSSRTSPQFLEALDDFKRVEASGWKAEPGRGAALATNKSATQRQFMEAVFTGQNDCQPLIHRLLFDGKCIAALLAVRYKATVAVLKIGYDESFRRLGPGQLLLRDLLEYCSAADGIHKVDMVSHTQWLAAWEPVVQPHHWCYLPIRPIGATLPLALLKLPRRN